MITLVEDKGLEYGNASIKSSRWKENAGTMSNWWFDSTWEDWALISICSM